MKLFSFSRLSLYDTCPHRFYKQYVEGYKQETTYPLALGSGVHRAIEDRMNGLDEFTAVLNGMSEADFHPDVTRDELLRLTNNAPIHQFKGETEIYFELPLADEENSPMIRGYIDVVDGNRIIDWKTNRAMYDVRDNHQIGLYSWAMSKIKGFDRVQGMLFFLRFRRASNFLYTQKEMEESRMWAYRLAKEIQGKLALVKAMPELKDELFPATPSSFCSHCPFAIDCYRKFSPVAKYIKKEKI